MHAPIHLSRSSASYARKVRNKRANERNRQEAKRKEKQMKRPNVELDLFINYLHFNRTNITLIVTLV